MSLVQNTYEQPVVEIGKPVYVFFPFSNPTQFQKIDIDWKEKNQNKTV